MPCDNVIQANEFLAILANAFQVVAILQVVISERRGNIKL